MIMSMDNLTGQQPVQPQPTPEETLAATNQALIQKKKKQQEQDNQNYDMAAISQAAAILQPKGKDPQVAVGKAINSNPGWANLCEAYAEKQVYGRTGLYPDAISAYKANAQAGNIVQSSKDIPKDAQVFFNADKGNGFNGHTMVSNGDGTFQTPLNDGKIHNITLSDWLKYSGQQYLGFVPPPSSKK